MIFLERGLERIHGPRGKKWQIRRIRCLDLRFDAILRIGSASIGFHQCCHATVLNRALIALERVPAQAHHLAGPGGISQFFGQIQQPNLVVDDSISSIIHEVTSCGFDGLVRASIKTGNPLSFNY